MGIMDKLARVMTDPIHRMPRKPQSYNDKYVVAYDFSEIGESLCPRYLVVKRNGSPTDRTADSETAVKELTTLLNDLEHAGLQTEVRAGYEQTLLIFVKAPRELLGNTVYKSRSDRLPHSARGPRPAS